MELGMRLAAWRCLLYTSYSGAETSTWLRQERSRLHSDYWLLDLLALRLAEMFPKQSAFSRAKTKSTAEAKANDASAARPQTVGVTRDDCYSMLLPMAVKTDDLSGKNGNGYAKALWENKKPVSYTHLADEDGRSFCGSYAERGARL